MSGLLISALAWSVILSRALVQFSGDIKVRLAVMQILLILLVLPLPDIAAAGVLRGMFGDFSYSTLVLLGLSLLGSLGNYRPFSSDQYRGTFAAIVIFALIFYPSSLGYGDIDLYSYGFGAEGVLAIVAVVGLIAWQEENYLLVLLIAIASLSFSFKLLESDNFWDYLLDPMLALYALAYMLLSPLASRSTFQS